MATIEPSLPEPPPNRAPGGRGEEPLAEGDGSNGAFALAHIRRQVRRLERLQPAVLQDRDPENLHQLRVGLRRLRSLLELFRPALVLPPGVEGWRLASLARRTGPCRDLDVLQRRLEQQLLPALAAEERQALAPWRKGLERERREALERLSRALAGPRWSRLLERLRRWQHKPCFSHLGRQPLTPWLSLWPTPVLAALFLHPGWWEEDPAADSLHGLRKRIKMARYALEPLEPFCPAELRGWIADLRQAQGHLGELHDLQVLEGRLQAEGQRRRGKGLTGLRQELARQRQEHWRLWCQQAPALQADGRRHCVQNLLLELGPSVLPIDGAGNSCQPLDSPGEPT